MLKYLGDKQNRLGIISYKICTFIGMLGLIKKFINYWFENTVIKCEVIDGMTAYYSHIFNKYKKYV